jgi:hypothetical protein
VITDENGEEMIPLTPGTRRLFNLHTRVTRPVQHYLGWSD